MLKQYHLNEYPMPESFRIYRDRVPVMGVPMRKADATAFCKGSGKQLAFQREPDNRHDPNAIRIMGSWKGWFSRKEKMLGYVPAEDAAKLVRLGLADSVRPRLLKTYLGTDGFVEIEIQIIGPKDLYRTFNPPPPPRAVSLDESAAEDENGAGEAGRANRILEGRGGTQRATDREIAEGTKPEDGFENAGNGRDLRTGIRRTGLPQSARKRFPRPPAID